MTSTAINICKLANKIVEILMWIGFEGSKIGIFEFHQPPVKFNAFWIVSGAIDAVMVC
jgi:hypothetical protein